MCRSNNYSAQLKQFLAIITMIASLFAVSQRAQAVTIDFGDTILNNVFIDPGLPLLPWIEDGFAVSNADTSRFFDGSDFAAENNSNNRIITPSTDGTITGSPEIPT